MHVEHVHEAARALGIAPAALDQVTTRVREHFGDGQVAPADLTAFLAGLPVWTKIGMEQQAFLAMPGTWRMDQARVFAPAPAGVHSRRPVTRSLTPAELAAHEAEAAEHGWSKAEANEYARVKQQTPLPEQP